MAQGELFIRQVVGDAPLRFTTTYGYLEDLWKVAVTYYPEGKEPVTFVEPLDEFPSDVLIAQLMLVV